MSKALCGQAPVGALFWIVAFGLMAAPFLGSRSALDAEGDDPGRAASELDIPFEEDVLAWEEEYGEPLLAPLREALERHFGAGSSAVGRGALLDPARFEPGRVAYEVHCIGCHGVTGDGAGPAARHLDPRPRNLRKGLFKITSTAGTDRPLHDDLLQTITLGLSGSSMPEHRLLSLETRRDLVEYVRYLAIRGEFEQLALDLAWEEEELPDFDEVGELVRGWWDPATLFALYPPISETPNDAASIERGRALYFEQGIANCVTCHGDTGVGDGPSAGEFVDGWGYPIRPRDLTTGVYRAGTAPAALYRSIAIGIKGTPMPSFAGSLEPEQVWDLVHFVQSLAR